MSAVSDYIYQQARPEQRLLLQLHTLILTNIPKVEGKIKWKIPFYSAQGLLCYLNPQPKNIIHLGFSRGSQLASAPYLLTGEGKQVRWVSLKTDQRVPEADLKTLLQEAYLLNSCLARKKKSNF